MTLANKDRETHGWLDGMAISASTLCMVHCLGLPILLAALPAVADRIDPGEGFHLLMLILATPTSAFALLSGWRKHRAHRPLVAGALGLFLMASGILFSGNDVAEIVLTVSGSVLLAAAHIANWRQRIRPRAQPVA